MEAPSTEKKNPGRAYCRETLIYIAPFAFAAGVLHSWYLSPHKLGDHALFEQARHYAIQEFGDRQPPLTDKERQQWLQAMGATGKPSRAQLKRFIDDYAKSHELQVRWMP